MRVDCMQVFSQVVYEMIEARSADPARGRFSRRNLLPRLALPYGVHGGAREPFFGEIIGAVGYIPLDVVIPVIMYLMALAPARRLSKERVVNVADMAAFVGLGVIGAVAAVRKLALNAGRFKLFSNGLY